MENQEPQRKLVVGGLSLPIVIVFLFSFVIGLYVWFGYYYNYSEITGSFLNALYTGLALAFLIVGVILQSREVKELIKQNEENKDYTKKLETSLEKRDQIIARKNKEETIVRLISLYVDVIRQEQEQDYKFFRERFLQIFNFPETYILDEQKNREKENLEYIKNGKEDPNYLRAVFCFCEYQVGYQFRFSNNLILRIFEYISHEFNTKNPDDMTSKKLFVNMVVDALDRHRLFILFFAAFSDKYPNLKKYIEEFGVLTNLNDQYLELVEYKKLYKESAFRRY